MPFVNPSWFELLSHKVMRLVCPWLLLVFFVASAWAAQPWSMGAFALDGVWLMRAFALGQLFLLLMAAAGTRAGRAGVVYRTFLVLNFAALVGLWRFVRGSQKITW